MPLFGRKKSAQQLGQEAVAITWDAAKQGESINTREHNERIVSLLTDLSDGLARGRFGQVDLEAFFAPVESLPPALRAFLCADLLQLLTVAGRNGLLGSPGAWYTILCGELAARAEES